MTKLSDKLERLAKDATPGPWAFTAGGGEVEIYDAGVSENGDIYPGCDELYIYAHGENNKCKSEDAALIVTLRNAVPEIIAALRKDGK